MDYLRLLLTTMKRVKGLPLPFLGPETILDASEKLTVKNFSTELLN